jgi:hypothetical protein
MSDSRTAGGLDRLPWLTDEPARKSSRAKHRSRDWTGWAAGAVLLVAGASFWLGSRSQTDAPSTSAPHSATVTVPEAQPIQPQVHFAPQPQVAPAPTAEVREPAPPQVRIAPPPVRKIVVREIVRQVVTEAPKQEQPAAGAATPAAPAAAKASSRPAQLTPWPPRVVAGASGRLVEIGAFGSVAQAKQGWRYMVRTFPAVAHLPAVVRPDRNSKGKRFYRFRIGTTSQAHSEVLCQRMQKIALSCAVVGLPWKAKVER